MITDPQELGIQLDVPDHELDKFENNYPQNVDRQLIEVIKYWQKNKNDCSWEALANAVERVGKYGNLVKELREKHSKHVQVRNVEDVADKTVREKTATKAR